MAEAVARVARAVMAPGEAEIAAARAAAIVDPGVKAVARARKAETAVVIADPEGK